jgi:hypothetical protein
MKQPKQTGHSKMEAKSADDVRRFGPIGCAAAIEADDVDEADKEDMLGFRSLELIVSIENE